MELIDLLGKIFRQERGKIIASTTRLSAYGGMRVKHRVSDETTHNRSDRFNLSRVTYASREERILEINLKEMDRFRWDTKVVGVITTCYYRASYLFGKTVYERTAIKTKTILDEAGADVNRGEF